MPNFLDAQGITLAVADYNSPESFDALLHGGDRVLLISGNEMHLDRTTQHKAVLAAAVKAGAALFAYTSAPSASPARSPTTTAPPRTPSSPPGSRTACCATTFTTRWSR